MFTHSKEYHPNIELKSQQRVLKFDLDKAKICFGRDAQWSDLVIPLMGWEALSRRHAILRKQGDHYVLIDGDGETPSRNGFFLENKRIDSQKPLLLKPDMQLTIGQNPKNWVQLSYQTTQRAVAYRPGRGESPVNRHAPTSMAAHRKTSTARETLDLAPKKGPSRFCFIDAAALKSKASLANFEIDLKRIWRWPVVIGRDKIAHCTSILLDAPTVSRHHVTIKPDIGGCYIVRNNSNNGTYVNQKKVDEEIILKEGDELKVGPYRFCLRRHILKSKTSLIDAW
ncbi:MAG: FHA domain-containing protein [Cyanobacteria bacterium P01_D01_bin.36]